MTTPSVMLPPSTPSRRPCSPDSTASPNSSSTTPMLSPDGSSSYSSPGSSSPYTIPGTPVDSPVYLPARIYTPSSSPERVLGASFRLDKQHQKHEPLTRHTRKEVKGDRQPAGFQYLDPLQRSFDWEVYGPSSPDSPDLSLEHSAHQTFKRALGPTEVSYYLGSRGEDVGSGVNDMYLHIGFKARGELMRPERLLDVWTEIISRHSLLASTVENYNGVHDIKFCYDPPKSSLDQRMKAKSLMELRTGQNQKELLDSYLNGERTLSDERPSYLVISTSEESFIPQDVTAEQEYDMHLFCTHFLGDGMALHTTANELFTLLSGDVPRAEDGSCVQATNMEAVVASRGDVDKDTDSDRVDAFSMDKLAQAMEVKVVTPSAWRRMGWTAARIEFNNEQARQIGGQTFARQKRGERKTLVPTVSWSSADTKKIIAKCKENKSTISHAMFALSNVAHIRSTPALDPTQPSMLYSALNLRPYLKGSGDWYHIAIGYYNIMLPSFMPSTTTASDAFWHRAASVRAQTSKVVKSKFLAARSQLMALEREERAIGFEIEDERRRQEKSRAHDISSALAGMSVGLGINVAPTTLQPAAPITEKKPVFVKVPQQVKKTPNLALMGLSMLGNLDAMYKHKEYQGLQLHTLTTGSRQRPGALLLFAYTFAGKLWMSLGYDSMGFKEGVIESWWSEMQTGVDEFLLA